MDIADIYILKFEEELRIRYLLLHTFILNSSELISVSQKYNQPFYICNGNQFYINLDVKRNQFYIGFCRGYLLKEAKNQLDFSNSKQVGKWYLSNEKDLHLNAQKLRSLILNSINLKS